MLSKLASMPRRAFAVALSTCLIAAVPSLSLAQGLPGLTLFGGPKRENLLNFRLDYGTAGVWDRYRLRIPAKKVQLAIAQFSIDYPEHYKGKFDKNAITVRVEGKKIPLQEVVWDKENRLIEIYPQEPIAANNDIEIVFSNVFNPTTRGMYQFNCRILTPGDVPLLRYIGSWVLTIS